MRKLKEIARLRFEAKRSYSEIAAAAGLSWPWPEGEDETSIEARLYGRAFTGEAWRATQSGAAVLPDFAAMRAELTRKGVTRRLLWREYREREPQGLEYSQFCELYRRWSKTQDVVMRFEHAPGDKLFVDYAGLTIGITDRYSGEVSPAQVFVAALGYSSYTYVEAVATQQVPDWIGAHVRALEFFGGVSQAIVIDNLNSGVARHAQPELRPFGLLDPKTQNFLVTGAAHSRRQVHRLVLDQPFVPPPRATTRHERRRRRHTPAYSAEDDRCFRLMVTGDSDRT